MLRECRVYCIYIYICNVLMGEFPGHSFFYGGPWFPRSFERGGSTDNAPRNYLQPLWWQEIWARVKAPRVWGVRGLYEPFFEENHTSQSMRGPMGTLFQTHQDRGREEPHSAGWLAPRKTHVLTFDHGVRSVLYVQDNMTVQCNTINMIRYVTKYSLYTTTVCICMCLDFGNRRNKF